MSASVKIPSSSSSASSSGPAHSQYSAAMAAGFFDWRRSRSPPRDLPRLSSSPSSDSDSDSEPPSPPESPTEPTWASAAAEAAQGVHYVLERFPACGRAPRAPPFTREPLLVHSGARVEVLDDVDDHAIRVRVLATGKVGLIPAYNVENPLERLARRNMQFNEAATCPVECRYRHSKSGELAHMHSRCMPFAFRRTLALSTGEADDEDSFDLDFDLDAPSPVAERARKTVGFAPAGRPVVFRYPSADVVDDADARAGEVGWWDGWEEERLVEEPAVHCDGEAEYEYAC